MTIFTEGGKLAICNNTPFDMIFVEQRAYQIDWGYYGKFPNLIKANNTETTHIEWNKRCVQKDSRASTRYKLVVNGTTYYLGIRGDYDEYNRYNLWADLHKGMGTLPSNIAKCDIGWQHNGVVQFNLFYDDETGIFLTSKPNPNPHRGTMRIGYYDLDKFAGEHTYAIMDQLHGSYPVEFHCYGGVNGKNKKYPANFYSQSKNRLEKELPCNPAVARVLASWSHEIDWAKTKYNEGGKKLKGTFGLGDSSGLVYGVTGVCHQMCNTILCATNPDKPLMAAVNWPNSFPISRFFFGIRGPTTHDKEIMCLVRAADSLDGTPDRDFLLEQEVRKSKKLILEEIKNQLNGINMVDQRETFVRETMEMVCSPDIDPAMKESITRHIIEVDIKLHKEKETLDRDIIQNKISKAEYASAVNQEAVELNNCYCEIPSKHLKVELTEVTQADVVIPDLIPEFAVLRRDLGI